MFECATIQFHGRSGSDEGERMRETTDLVLMAAQLNGIVGLVLHFTKLFGFESRVRTTFRRTGTESFAGQTRDNPALRQFLARKTAAG